MRKLIHHLKGESSLVITAPHIGTKIPRWEAGLFNKKTLEKKGLWPHAVDIGVEAASGFKLYDSAARIWTEAARVFFDVNRLRTDAGWKEAL